MRKSLKNHSAIGNLMIRKKSSESVKGLNVSVRHDTKTKPVQSISYTISLNKVWSGIMFGIESLITGYTKARAYFKGETSSTETKLMKYRQTVRVKQLRLPASSSEYFRNQYVTSETGSSSGSQPAIQNNVGVRQVMEGGSSLHGVDFSGAPGPVLVMLNPGYINVQCELVEPNAIRNQFWMLNNMKTEAVIVICFWGIVEAHGPKEYKWKGYRKMFDMASVFGLKVKVEMAFLEHAYGDYVPVPSWVDSVEQNGALDFKGRTSTEVYLDYIKSFHLEFEEFIKSGVLSLTEG